VLGIAPGPRKVCQALSHLVLRFFSSLLSMSSCVSIAWVCALKLMVCGSTPLASRSASSASTMITLLPTPVTPVNSTLRPTSTHSSMRREYLRGRWNDRVEVAERRRLCICLATSELRSLRNVYCKKGTPAKGALAELSMVQGLGRLPAIHSIISLFQLLTKAA
jgi:hypothetical protein